MHRSLPAFAFSLLTPVVGLAQAAPQSHVVGSVPATDATTTGVLEVSSGRSVLGSSSTITAGPRPARVTLFRGGALEVCQGSTLRMNASLALGRKPDPLVIGLNRGALELQTTLTAGDAVMTPDLRITTADTKDHGIDLALRVTRNGDTCIDNRGKKAPVLTLSNVFDNGTYQLKPGQRALFEHGSLHEVVDREQGPCGCPAYSAIADSKQPFPFPEAVSEGLTEPGPPPPEAPGVTHTQVATTLSADPSAEPPPPVVPVPAPPEKPGFFASIGHFFKHIFVR